VSFLRWLRNQWDRVAGAGLMAAGAVVLVLGWVGAADAIYPAEQIPFLLSGGLLGVFLLGLGATAWISADLRDEWRKLDRLEEILTTDRLVELDEMKPESATVSQVGSGEVMADHPSRLPAQA
jgi:hypothetical protein